MRTVPLTATPATGTEAFEPLLGPLVTIEPLPARGAVHHAAGDPSRTGTVWKSLRGQGADEGGEGDRLMNLRHFAVLGLQTRLRCLVSEHVDVSNLALRLFLSPHTDHAYVDGPLYRRMAAAAAEVLGVPEEFPVFIDVRRECLVIDTSRGFEGGGAQVTAATVHGVAALCESRRFAAYLQERPQLLGTGRAAQHVACGLVLQASARCVLRAALQEPGLQVSQLARQLARQAGADVVARALLAGAVAETRTTVEVFLRLWRERRPVATHAAGAQGRPEPARMDHPDRLALEPGMS